MTLIDEVVPPVVVTEEEFVDPPGLWLFQEEEASVARAVASRRQEFTTTRHCARRALRRLGLAPVSIVPGERGAPRWPSGVVGSMTHCAGYRAAALAHQRDVVTTGIDAEPHERLPEGVLHVVTVASERSMLARLERSAPRVCWDRLLFSAKESTYKAWFPLTRRWLGFEEAEVVIDPGVGRFVARLLVPGPTIGGRQRQELEGQYVVRGGLVVTAVTVTA